MTGFIYKVTNKVTGESYIGQTRNTVEFRWRQHKHAKDCYCFHKAIQQYGEENFIVETLEECDVEKLDEREIYYIAKYNTFRKGYNMTKGGSPYNPDRRYTNGYIVVDNKYDEITQMYLAGYSATKIADIYQVDRYVICNILKDLGFKLKHNVLNINNELFEEIVKDYKSGYSLKALAKRYGCSAVGLKDFLVRKGVDLRVKYQILQDTEAQLNLIKDYLNSTDYLKNLLLKYHCEYSTFKKILKLHNIEPKGKGGKLKLSDTESLLVIKLFNEKVPVLKIADLFQVDKCTIYSLLKRYNVNYKKV